MAITKDEANKKAEELLKNFKNNKDNENKKELAVSDIIENAYNNNKAFQISELEDIYTPIRCFVSLHYIIT